uniref:hypothetical protein n=1 Tax=Terasakiella pusilla TaxID=64973 RepID=UPI003AA8A2DF
MLKLQLSDQKPITAVEKRKRPPLVVFIEAVEQQMKALDAERNGKTLKVNKERYVPNGHETEKVEKEVRIRPWWWEETDDAGNITINITMRYGSQIINIDGKPTIVAGQTLDDVEAVFQNLLEAASS